MPSKLSGVLGDSTTDQLRLEQQRAHVQRQTELETREIRARNGEDVARLQDDHQRKISDLHDVYKVKISQEAEALEEQLHKVQLESDKRISSEKRLLEQEFTKVKQTERARIEEYKKNSEAQLNALRKQHQVAAENLHKKSVQNMKRDRERDKETSLT